MAIECDVLVVDDEAVVRDGIRRILEAQGLRVAEAADGAAALAHPGLRSCRLVLCDLVLPDRAGTEIVEALRSARPGLPVVMITGYSTAHHAALAIVAGAKGFLAKPFEEAELLNEVRRHLPQNGAAAREGRP